MTGLNEIRSIFLDYFAKQGHDIVASGSLVPHNDPSLMFTNAGMVPFKNIFTGQESIANPRATSAQKCVRAGGKHNDLDNVGYTARHHTFFEMMGNFSFGDYFKEDAIAFAWELITKEYGLPRDKLLVTVYHEDDEAYRLWQKIAGLPDRQIIRIATSDNFWSMGETGPCGPSSEIFYDHGEQIFGGPPGSPDEDGDRFVEIWNLVFMQYEQVDRDTRIDLPKPSIDTGMGLERMAAVLQGTHNNFEIDLFRNLISASVEKSGVASQGEHVFSHRIIADHLRSASFLIADGVLPSNEGRGYVLRRIMRRAMRHAHLLGTSEPLMYQLVPALIREMGDEYTELGRAGALITETLKLEESRFKKTLERGLNLLETEMTTLKKGGQLPGDVAFKLYDTYGFPVDLTEDALRSHDISVDRKGFEEKMEGQREKARKAWSGSGGQATDSVWLDLREKLGATEFLGYQSENAEGKIVAILVDGKQVRQVSKGAEALILTNQTPFYAESGGQAGDIGRMTGVGGAQCSVSDTLKQAGALHCHVVSVTEGSFSEGDVVDLEVDHEKRRAVKANHSATHLLHEALRQVLGEHVAQKGSQVTAERLRFDFSHNKPMSVADVQQAEDLVNDIILQNNAVTTRLMDMEDAVEAGALALFGEKYDSEVRVVAMGQSDSGRGNDKHYSVELCGGIHAERTGDIGLLKIINETAVASGVRRIEALTAKQARHFLTGEEMGLRMAADLLKTTPKEVSVRLKALIQDKKQLERDLSEAKKKLAMGGGADEGEAVRDLGAVKMMARVVHGIAPKDLRSLSDAGKQQIGSGIVVIIGISEDGRAAIIVGVTKDQSSRFNAVELVRTGSAILGGKGGGGRPEMAQAGGPDGKRAEEALDAIEKQLVSQLGGDS